MGCAADTKINHSRRLTIVNNNMDSALKKRPFAAAAEKWMLLNPVECVVTTMVIILCVCRLRCGARECASPKHVAFQNCPNGDTYIYSTMIASHFILPVDRKHNTIPFFGLRRVICTIHIYIYSNCEVASIHLCFVSALNAICRCLTQYDTSTIQSNERGKKY